jgi:predicted enzyme related to lactoylglutathione lyase
MEVERMPLSIVALSIDANDPLMLATFWGGALRWDVSDRDGPVVLGPTDRTQFQIEFRPVPGPKRSKNTIHLDLTTETIEDQRGGVEQLLARGGSHVDVGQVGDEGHVVLADPEGNEFCLIEPGNVFLSECERLGSITCDGSPRVGYFWGAALGWPLVWDQDGETAIRSPDGVGPFITWGPPVPENRSRNRLHLHVAPIERGDLQTEVDRLISLGAREVDLGQGDIGWVVMADPDGNEFCVLPPRSPGGR